MGTILKLTGQQVEGDVFSTKLEINAYPSLKRTLSKVDGNQTNLIEDEASWQLGQTAADRSEGEGGDDHQRQRHDPQHHERRYFSCSWKLSLFLV